VYTVKQPSDLAGISPRTLHFYDEIGLLKPVAHGDNGYRYYGEEALPRLQQILFFKELDFSLDEIQAILAQPGFDVLHALQVHTPSGAPEEVPPGAAGKGRTVEPPDPNHRQNHSALDARQRTRRGEGQTDHEEKRILRGV
jgi:DNA-binding transcriptional MerR regulator